MDLLPDSCLLAVLQYLSDDPISVLSAARSHSRLHQAAVMVLRSIQPTIQQQEQVDSLLLYLDRHGQHLDSIKIKRDRSFRPTLPQVPQNNSYLQDDMPSKPTLRQLPKNLHLNSLHFEDTVLQLQPGDGFQGVLGTAAAATKQLHIHNCVLLGKTSALATAALAAALLQLPDLEHINISCTIRTYVRFPTQVLQQLQQLTSLELDCGWTQDAPAGMTVLPLHAATRLADLRLYMEGPGNIVGHRITADMLSGACNLTCLVVVGCVMVEPDVLAGKTRLQHLAMIRCNKAARGQQRTQLLSQLQYLQQLTYLSLQKSLHALDDTNPPPADYSALTASSKLQSLCISYCTLPAAVWQHVFPAGRELPQLQTLDATGSRRSQCQDITIAVPDGSLLVSCCPDLQHLDVDGLQYSAELLASLQGLTGLQTLSMAAAAIRSLYTYDVCRPAVCAGLEMVCQLTGLRQLSICAEHMPEGLLLQLTQLKQLTQLSYSGLHNGVEAYILLRSQTESWGMVATGHEPVWRQVLHLHLHHIYPHVALQAAAALAE